MPHTERVTDPKYRDPRSENHWIFEDYRQRMITKHWKWILLRNDDVIIFQGERRKLKAKNLGAGVVEVYKESLKNEA